MEKIVIFGSGGISMEIAFLIEDINKEIAICSPNYCYEILGYVESDDANKGKMISGYRVLGNFLELDEEIDSIVLPIGTPGDKKKIYENEILKFPKKLKMPNLIHPTVIQRDGYIKIGFGNIICAGNILTTDIEIGNFNLINLSCTVGHETKIGDYNVINPLVAISGGVKISNQVLIGTGAKILQYKKIGDNAIIGAGAVITKDVPADITVVGIPAKKLE